MKRGPFAPAGFCCPAHRHYYDPLRLPLSSSPFPGITGYRRASLPNAPQALGPRRLSPVPEMTIRPFHAHYAGGFLGARSRIPGTFRGLRRRGTGSAPPLPPPAGGPIDDACSGFTRVADRTVARPRFAPGLSTTHGGSATKDPGISPDRTHTGRPSRTSRSYAMTNSLSSQRPSSLGALHNMGTFAGADVVGWSDRGSAEPNRR